MPTGTGMPPAPHRAGSRPADDGLTLVELLVVVLVIGVLSAIALPTFLTQRHKAWDGASRAELRHAAAALESLHVDAGSYADGSVASGDPADLRPLHDQGFALSGPYAPGAGGSFAVVVSGTGSSAYCIQVAHGSRAGTPWVLRSADGLPQRVGSGTPAVAACTA